MKLIAPDTINDILEALDRQIEVHGGSFVKGLSGDIY